MNEAEWFEAESPYELHQWVIGTSDPACPAGWIISDRLKKLGTNFQRIRLFVRECHRLLKLRRGARVKNWKYNQQDIGSLLSSVAGWTGQTESDIIRHPELATLYREIIGDPFRLVPEAGKPWRRCWSCQGYGCHQGAGPDRGNHTCEECRASGWLRAAWMNDQIFSLAVAAKGGTPKRTTRRIKLDPARLNILADACQDVCPPEAMEIVQHLMGYRPCFTLLGSHSGWSKDLRNNYHPPDCWALSMILGEYDAD